MNRHIQAAAILVVGAVLRLFRIELPPLHHDEGINAYFMVKLVREGIYRYDPANYHGPTLYYLDLPLLKLFGLETFNLRLLPALFGVALLALIIAGRTFSRRAALCTAALVALSPGMVYFSRYFIHEMMVVFFTLGIITAIVWRQKELTGLRLVAAASSAGFLFATKETAAPTLVVLALAAGLSLAVMRRSGRGEAYTSDRMKKANPTPADENTPRAEACFCAVASFAAINSAFYSSFFDNMRGVSDALGSLVFWTATGTKDHLHPVWQYIGWMLREESTIFLLGSAGIALAFFRRNSTTALFCGFWSLGMLAMYSIIPYKTPWLTLNIVLPFALMTGYALDEGFKTLREGTVATVAVCAGIAGLYQCISLNFVHYDNNSHPYVYAHTVRDVDRLARDVKNVMEKKGRDTAIAVVADQYWPLPWMWLDYRNAMFYGKMAPLDQAPVVLSLASQEEEVRRQGKGEFKRAGAYMLRPGVDLLLWVRY